MASGYYNVVALKQPGLQINLQPAMGQFLANRLDLGGLGL